MTFLRRQRIPAAAVLAVAKQRALALRSIRFSELAKLPRVHEETVPIDGCEIKVTTCRDLLPGGSASSRRSVLPTSPSWNRHNDR
jgi:hypothetical protein